MLYLIFCLENESSFCEMMKSDILQNDSESECENEKNQSDSSDSGLFRVFFCFFFAVFE